MYWDYASLTLPICVTQHLIRWTPEGCNQIMFSIYELLFIDSLFQLYICASQIFTGEPENLMETWNNKISGGPRETMRKWLSVLASLISAWRSRLCEQSFALARPANFYETLRWSQCSELWGEMEEQISPTSVQPLMTQQQPRPKGEAMQGWMEQKASAAFELFVWQLSPAVSSFQILFFFSSSSSQKPPLTWIRVVCCHDGFQWHTQLCSEAE